MATSQNKPATKADITAVKQDVAAVKQEVAAVKQDVAAVKQDIKRLDKKIDQAAEKITTTVINHIDALIENRADDVLGVTKDEVSLIKDKQNDHEERITTVEQKIGLRG